ncbi:hypothetical protein B0I35DRAFT_453199 [Stachybotrys elegans]|uniref:Inactive metallocarboxypeptidase ECM14 n=1 Tax=Stachybotrys elegans TaxID=80388 RepID=A0A8K0SJI9_9HYPO|nr:hypothetical protein B0I35DRAFT_453199 [Stachybotrys elegans]
MRPSTLRLVASLLLLSQTTSAADHGQASLFPLLTKVRNGLVEFFFGKHPTKASSRSSTLSNLQRQYADELVLRFNVSTSEEEEALSHAAARLFLDVWSSTDEYVDIRLHTAKVAPLLSLLPESLHSSQRTLIPDLAAAVYQSLPSDTSASFDESESALWSQVTPLTTNDNIFFQDYQSLPVIIRWMRLLEAMFPSYVKYTSIGLSYEEREIPALRVGLQSQANPEAPRKTIVVTGGLHAREWISTSTVNYVAWSLITSFGKETLITKLLSEYDIVFLPVVNPDGVEYSWEVDRLWRKSRQETNFRYCRGLDLDHTFGYEWDNSLLRDDPCSERYGGEEPFQAVEAVQLANWARNQTLEGVQFIGLLDLHSYSQQVLLPYTYTCAVDPPNMEKLEELGAGIAKAIRLSSGETYTVTSACSGALGVQKSKQRSETGGGSAIDWFYHEMGAHYSYQIKLRDTGAYGFLLPKEYIIPTGEEMVNAIKYFGDYLLGNNGIERFNTGHIDTATHAPAAGSTADNEAFTHELKMRLAR